MAAPALPAEVEQLRQQLLRDQAPSVRSRSNYFDPSVFAARHRRPYSSRNLSIETMMEMRTDALLRFSQLIALVPLFTSKWRIECSDARKAAFVDKALRRIIGRFIVQAYESWNFGFQAVVKQFALMNPGWEYLDKETGKTKPVWDGGSEVPALVWDSFVTLNPKMVRPVWTQSGAFNGIALSTTSAGGFMFPFPTVNIAPTDVLDTTTYGGGGVAPSGPVSYNVDSQYATKVDVDHSLWIVNERDGQWGSVWGNSRLSYAYKYWWSYEMTLGILNRSVERKGDPTIVVSYPQGTSMVNGVETPNSVIAQQIGQAARSGAVLTVPSEVWGEDTGTSNQASKWRIDYLKAEEQFDKLQAVLHYLDTQKIRSMAISELAFAEGTGGTSSRNVAATTGERSFEVQIFTQVEWDEIINRYLIPQLADADFPELKDVPARKVTSTFGQDESQLAADLLRSIANANPGELPIDLPALLERFQIDALTGTELEKFQANLVTQAEQKSRPPTAPAQPSTNGRQGAAGVTDTGFYYDPPERIELSDDEDLMLALPRTRHYADRAVLAQTRLLRRLWKAHLAATYEDFAVHLEESKDLGLAEGDRRAGAVVAAWRYVGDTAKVVKATAVALGKIVARAGALELSASRIGGEFDASAQRVDDWTTENVAALVRYVDKTTRDQLSTFVAARLRDGQGAADIAKGVRSHFAEFPSWRADMIARTEAMRFYNAGTLFAAEGADAQVQALDAQKGPTDPECEHRNGQILSVQDAWQESVRVHPRDTLAFRIVPRGVQFTWHSREEMGSVAARIDQEERVVHLVEGLDPATESRYLERAVDWLVASDKGARST